MTKMMLVAMLALLMIGVPGSAEGPTRGATSECLTTTPAENPYPASQPEYVRVGPGVETGTYAVAYFHQDTHRWSIATAPCEVLGLALRCVAEADANVFAHDCTRYNDFTSAMAYEPMARVTWTAEGLTTGSTSACDFVTYYYGYNPIWGCTFPPPPSWP